MKISKLFHWLYAVLMFLPILIFLPTGLYYAFNDNATAQEKVVEIPNYYQTNEINSYTDFTVGNVYTYTNNFNTENTYNWFQLFDVKVMNGIYKDLEGYIFLSNSSLTLRTDEYTNLNAVNFDFLVTNIYTTIDQTPNELLIKFTECETNYENGTYHNVSYTMSITDSMTFAWDETWHNDLFSWSNDSFLTVPFRYLTDLFSIPSSSTIIYAFSYWLTISIVWLCFDVLIYVPQLAHRWLDKASLE